MSACLMISHEQRGPVFEALVRMCFGVARVCSGRTVDVNRCIMYATQIRMANHFTAAIS